MARNPVFEFVCEQLENETALDRLEARGTVRLTLKSAGFDPSGIVASDMAAVLSRLLPKELASRGVDRSAELCGGIVRSLGAMPDERAVDSPEAVFERLGSR